MLSYFLLCGVNWALKKATERDKLDCIYRNGVAMKLKINKDGLYLPKCI